MRRLATILVLLLLLLLQPAPAPFSAVWQRPGVAAIRWTQPAGVSETCLFRRPVSSGDILIGCWDDLPEGATGLSLGASGPMDGAYRPQAHDIFVLTMDGADQATQLRALVYVASFRG